MPIHLYWSQQDGNPGGCKSSSEKEGEGLQANQTAKTRLSGFWLREGRSGELI